MSELTMKDFPLWKWVLKLLAGFVVFFIIYALSPTLGYIFEDVYANAFGFAFAACLMLALYYGFVLLLEHRKPSELSYKRFLPDSSWGFAVGAVFMCTITLILYLCNSYTVVECSEFYFDAFFNYFCFYFLVAVGEEIIFRGFLFRYIRDRFGLVIALVVSSVVFGFVHIFNDNATVMSCLSIAIEAGLLLGVAYHVSNTLWMPVGLHLAWNYIQGVVFGYPVSGNGSDYSLFVSEVSGSDIITGGEFGPEASVFTAVLGVVASILLMSFARKLKKG